MTALRIVLDTNTLLSALLFGRPRWTWLREAWKAGIVVPVVCSATTLELIRVLGYPKFHLEEPDQEAILEEILPFCETTSNPSEEPGLVPCRDPSDQVFLELAQVAGVSYLVSGDKDLLEYSSPLAFQIVPPDGLRRLLSETPGS
jgi:uncharacterized protein